MHSEFVTKVWCNNYMTYLGRARTPTARTRVHQANHCTTKIHTFAFSFMFASFYFIRCGSIDSNAVAAAWNDDASNKGCLYGYHLDDWIKTFDEISSNPGDRKNSI